MDEDSSDSEYNVEEFVKPKRTRHTPNGDAADLLGNFDDAKRKEILDGTYGENEADLSPSDCDDDDSLTGNSEQKEVADTGKPENSVTNGDEYTDPTENRASDDEVKTDLTKEQLAALMRGAAKANRHVLYVTNLNFDTTKTDLELHFARAGTVKSVRVPKKRRGGFAFVEMADIEGYQRAFQMHNTTLQARVIKVQFSEAGKKKSANKKNILKQKNRKLAEMRNEQKTFTKSGKFYDKNLKKEKAKDLLARKRWRKPAATRGNSN